MSRYLVDKFLYRVDRNELALQEYIRDPAGFVVRWEENEGPRLADAETTSGHRFSDEERTALATRDFEKLYALGAHPFILWTLMLPVYEREITSFPELVRWYNDKIRPYGRPDYAT